MSVLIEVLGDLSVESDQIEFQIAGLVDPGWARITTPEGWTIAHQIAHLLWTDEASVLAMSDPAGFNAQLEAAATDPENFVDAETHRIAQLSPGELLDRWRLSRRALAEGLAVQPEGAKIPWFGPPMSPASMATARMMETWAHGHDIAEALGTVIEPSDRVKHVCHLGVRTRRYAYAMRGEQAPDSDIAVTLTAPSSQVWTWGNPTAEQTVTGSAWDFALLATRRRHRDDVDIIATGDDADHWLDIIQAFAGLPGNDPKRLSTPQSSPPLRSSDTLRGPRSSTPQSSPPLRSPDTLRGPRLSEQGPQ